MIVVPAWPGQPMLSELERGAAAGERPRTDYVELARCLAAEVVDAHYMAVRRTGLTRRPSAVLGLERAQVAEVFRHRAGYRSIIAWGDRLGMQLALLLKLARSRRDLVMVSHWISTRKRSALTRGTGFHSHVKSIINYSSVQLEFAASLGVPRQKLELLLQPVDDCFWRPAGDDADDVICSVGAEARDYPTLLEAVTGLDVVVELALGTVSGKPRGLPGTMANVSTERIPETVRIHRFLTPLRLRELYRRSRIVVVPLRTVDIDAGVTTITEAMAMGKPVIVTRTRGQVDLIEHGRQGLYVSPGDPVALRRAIADLLADPAESARMGEEGRALVERRHTIDAYVDRFASIVRA